MLEDAKLMTKALCRRFVAEAMLDGGNGQFYALMLRSNRQLLAFNPGSPELDPMQMMWAGDVLRLLNKELDHGGGWVVVFTCPDPQSGLDIISGADSMAYGRYALMWLDHDGDVQFSQEWQKNDGELLDFADVINAGILSTAQKCEASWNAWKMLMVDVIDPAEGQTFNKAGGETPTSARH